MIKQLTIALVATMIFAVNSASAVLFSENFDVGTVGPLFGQTADTGQTWGALTWTTVSNDMAVSSSIGTIGKGAGVNAAGTHGSEVLLGTTLTTGVVTIDFDFARNATGASAGADMELILNNPSGGSFFSIILRDEDLRIEGQGVPGVNIPSGFAFGDSFSVHTTTVIDLDAKTATLSWFDVFDPGDLTTSGNFVRNFAAGSAVEIDRISLLGVVPGAPFGPETGFDKIVVVIPEPASLALMGLGGVLMFTRRRNANRM